MELLLLVIMMLMMVLRSVQRLLCISLQHDNADFDKLNPHDAGTVDTTQSIFVF